MNTGNIADLQSSNIVNIVDGKNQTLKKKVQSSIMASI